MAWPTAVLSLANLADAANGKPSLARAEMLSMAQAVKDMIASNPTLSGGAGKMELGAPPDARWGAGVNVIQFSGESALYSVVVAGTMEIGIVTGAYYDDVAAVWKYTAAGTAASRSVFAADGTVKFETASVSVTIDQVVTWLSDRGIAGRGARYYQDTSGAGAYPGAGQAVAAIGLQKLAFIGQGYDTDMMMNVAKDRFTIPAGISAIELGVSVKFKTPYINGPTIQMQKNGVPMYQDGITGTFGGNVGGGRTGRLQVVAGDYFEIFVSGSGSAETIMDEGTWFDLTIIK